MKIILEDRVIELANYISDNHSTVRDAAGKFGVSKSTVHTDMTKRLKSINPDLYAQIRQILDQNKAQRHIRGGLATKKKFEQLHK